MADTIQESNLQLANFMVTPPAGGLAIPLTFQLMFSGITATGGKVHAGFIFMAISITVDGL